MIVRSWLFSCTPVSRFPENSDVHRDAMFGDEDMDIEEDDIDFMASSAVDRELLGMWFPMVSGTLLVLAVLFW